MMPKKVHQRPVGFAWNFNYHLAFIYESARRTVRACTRIRVQGELEVVTLRRAVFGED